MATAIPSLRGLDPSVIESLMANSRERNAYGPRLMEFLNSDEAAINVADVWPLQFKNKNATTLYQGFLNAAKKANVEDQIWIKQNDGQVYILHKERVGLVME